MLITKRFISSVVLAIFAPFLFVTGANAAPANDNIASATQFSGSSVAGTTSAASDESGEFNQSDPQFQKSVWYYWEPSSTGTVTFDVCGSTPVTKINAYETVSGNALSTVPTSATTSGSSCSSGDDQKASFTATTGKRYYIQVLTKNGDAGSFTLNYATGSSGSGGGGSSPSITPLAKVTICHRTHSVTNPYVVINVSTSSIVDAASASNGHGLHNSDRTRTNKGIFNPPYAKQSQKYWGDIIPPFTATNGGTFAGLNWHWGSLSETGDNLDKTEFRAINPTTAAVAGTSQYMIDALALCQGAAGDKTSKELYEIERKSGQNKQDILDEMESDEKTSVESQLPTNEGPKGLGKKAPDQSLSGIVWLDLNRNGFQESNEPNMPGIEVTVGQTDPSLASNLIGRFTNSGGGKAVVAAVRWFERIPILNSVIDHAKSLIRTATTYKVVTDANGAYLFKSIGAGDWTVVGVVPAGLEVTYDSYGVSDASVDATVPVSGHAFTWVGLVGTSSIEAPIKNPDGTPVTEKITVEGAGPDGKFGTDDDVTYEVTPVDGKLVLDGIPPGNYRIIKIGSSYYLATFTVGTSEYVASLSPKKTTKAALAATGAGDASQTAGLIILAISSVAIGFSLMRRSKTSTTN